MGTATNPDRQIRLYFGRPGDPRPSKDEVAEFITDDMGLVQGEGKPRWSEGIGELIELGMDAWTSQIEPVVSGSHERVAELEEQVASYRMEVEQLTRELEQRRQGDGALDPAERVHRIEARILEVLCRDEYRGAKSMNYVDLYELTEQTGLEYATVVKYTDTLSRPAFGEHVQLDAFGEEVKAASHTQFEHYCEGANLDPETIRARNRPL